MLENRDKKNPFSIPENYFQNFNAEIMNNLPEKEVHNKKIVPLWKTATRWTAIAAAITGLTFFGINYMDTKSNQPIGTGTIITSGNDTESLEEDYYLFLEDEATKLAYRDVLYNE